MKISPADKAFADCVKYEAKNICARCGVQRERAECSHIHGRRHRTIRWCKDNAICKCHTCHRWWHENPTESGEWFKEKYGEERVNILLIKKNMRQKVSKIEEKEIAKHYRQQLKLMKEGQETFESWQ
jgi:hypothetical protein